MAQVFKPIAVTLGDAGGIGPEIIAMAFRDAPEKVQGCVVVGDLAVMQRAVDVLAVVNPSADRVRLLALPCLADLPEALPALTLPVFQVGMPLVPEKLPQFGCVSAEAGRLAADAVVWAAQAALRGDLAALVTAPLHKEALFAAGVPFPGHTEMLQACAAAHMGVSVGEMPVRMMLANRELRTVLVSIHVPLRQAIDAVTVENILQTLRITHAAELAATGRVPHMGVAGLNPHAGEGGLMGREELDIIVPALQQARGHQPGDFDVVIAMYHDQGLIPVKYFGVEQGVNITLGLPLVRTSPDHGTAFDLAGTGRASPASLLEALDMARRLSAGSLH